VTPVGSSGVEPWQVTTKATSRELAAGVYVFVVYDETVFVVEKTLAR